MHFPRSPSSPGRILHQSELWPLGNGDEAISLFGESSAAASLSSRRASGDTGQVLEVVGKLPGNKIKFPFLASESSLANPPKEYDTRINNCLLPNASFIRILVLNLPSNEGRRQAQLSGKELSLIWRLLGASGRVRHLAVTWNIWADLERECGALRLEGLYLMWDGAFNIHAPSLHHLQHPSALKDLTIYAPPYLCNPMPFRSWGQSFLPATTQCVNLTYVTYAARRMPFLGVEDVDLKGAMLVLVGRTEPYNDQDKKIKKQWVAKMDGRESLLTHPAEIAAADNE
ncbi:hypothetical protein DFH09DRAFT_1302239 [Mycena vulgaris]|nr:hypothetical protein DFH09DRAFT_1302239 [Mycena vulgaris]